MAASFVDALLGYEYYLQSRGQTSIDEINEHLQQNRRVPISLRTYQHYKKLISTGFRSYVPINRFDVAQSLGKLQIAADRRRYVRNQTNLPAKISIDKTTWADCVVENISLVGLGIRTAEKFAITPGKQAWIQLEGYELIQSFVAWRKHEGDYTLLGIRAIEFIDNFRIGNSEETQQRLTSALHIVRNVDESIDWNHLIYVLEKSTELIESTTALLLSLQEITNTNVIIARPKLESIHFGSPGGAEIKIDFGIADILKVVFDALQNIGLKRNRYRVETESIEIDNQRKRIENAARQIELLRSAFNVASEAQTKSVKDTVIERLIRQPLKDALGVERLPVNLFDENSLERGILEERILPAAAELINGDDPTYEISVIDEP